jgi:predicted negative regulator of RcsB-dependent stress response
MRATLHGAAFASYAGRFVWLDVNFDDPRNEKYLASHVSGFPALSIIDPETEDATRIWMGSATPDQLAAFLDAAPDDAIRRGDTMLAKNDGAGAVKAYDEAIAKGGPNHDHAVEQLSVALQIVGDNKQCASRLAAEAAKMPRAHPFINVVIAGGQCAAYDPSLANSDDGTRLEAFGNEALALPAASEDDHYMLFESTYTMRKTADDRDGAKAVAERYLAYIDQRPAPTSDDERMARDLARVRAAIKLGVADTVIGVLETSEKALANDADASMRLATAYEAAKRPDDALAAAARGLTRSPTPTQAARFHAMRAKQLAAKGDSAGARTELEAGLAIVATIPSAMMRDATRGQLQHQLDALK